MKNRFILFSLLLLLLFSCSITPEEIDRALISPELKHLNAPSDFVVESDSINRRIELNWAEVPNATHYIVEYQSVTDYLSGKPMRTFVTNNTYFTLSSFQNDNDKRYVFRVKASSKGEYSSLESGYTDLKEGAVVDNFSLDLMIRDSMLCFYVSHPKNSSVLKEAPIVECSIRFFEGDWTEKDITDEAVEIKSGEREVYSDEEITITSVLYADGKEIIKKKASVKGDISYIPLPLLSLNGSKGEKDGITLKWECPKLNEGLEKDKTQISFIIERREKDSQDWVRILDSSGSEYFKPPVEADISESFNVSAVDYTAEAGKDYIYRVMTCYEIGEGDSVFKTTEDSAKSLVTDICYTADKTVKSFVLKNTEFEAVEGDGIWTVDAEMEWSLFHSLPEGYCLKVRRIAVANDSLTAEDDGFPLDAEFIVSASPFKDTIKLSAKQKRDTKTFIYNIYMVAPDGTESDAYTATGSNGEAANVTIPGEDLTQIIIPDSLTATGNLSSSSDKLPLSSRINLSWSVAESYPEGFKTEKVWFEVLKLEGETYQTIATLPFETREYSDKVGSSETYSYAVRPIYVEEDESASDYIYVRPYPLSESVKGSTLADISPNAVSVSRNEYADRIVVKWNSVEHASAYRVTWTSGNGKVHSTDTRKCILEITDIAKSDYGKDIEVTVKAVDAGGEATKGVSKNGMVLGTVTPLITNGDKSIKVTWDSVEGATRYKVNVYNENDENAGEPLYSVDIDGSAKKEFVLSSSSDIIEKNKENTEYPLSKSYWFSVIPYIGNSPSPVEARAEGHWIMPPKNISATKAAYRDMIELSWDRENDSDVFGYRVYYKKPDETEWKQLQLCKQVASGQKRVTCDIINMYDIYDFSVATVTADKEGPIQNYFHEDSSFSDINERLNNRGYVILKPTNLICDKDETREYFTYSFDQMPGISSYKISAPLFNTIEITEGILSGTEEAPEGVEVSVRNGRIAVTTKRPDASNSVIIRTTVSALSENAVISDRNDSIPAVTETMVNNLFPHEIINIVSSMLSKPYRGADDFFKEDWYQAIKEEAYKGLSNVTITRCYYSASEKRINGITTLNKFSSNDGLYTINGSLENFPRDPKNAWNLSGNPLDYIHGEITLELPYKFGTKRIKLENFKVSGDQTGTVYINDAKVESDEMAKINVKILGSTT